MVSSIKMGDKILCVNAEGVEEYGISYGGKYIANQVIDIPGQGSYVGAFHEALGKVVLLEASRFEVAHDLLFRVYQKSGNYYLLDDSFTEDMVESEGREYIDIKLTIPESQLEDIDKILGHAVKQLTEGSVEDETLN